MMYRVLHEGQPIGESRLEGRDQSMGVAFGAFSPLPAYEAVRAVFLMFTEATAGATPDEARLAEYDRARDALSLSLVDEAGALVPTNWIHIVDGTPWGLPGDHELECRIPDRAFFSARS